MASAASCHTIVNRLSSRQCSMRPSFRGCPPAMLLNKTALAREALQAGSGAGLSVQERRILIMTDGKRSLNDVMALLGADILPAIDRLIRDGYIDDGRGPTAAAPPQAKPAQGLGGALGGLIRAATESVQARTEQIRAATTTPPTQALPAAAPQAVVVAPAPVATPAPARNGQRRSLVAAKIYIIDMLQLQRHADAVELKARIQFTSGEPDLLEAILDGMRVLLQLTNESYGQRIVARLHEVLPEHLLPELDAATAACGIPVAKLDRVEPPQLKVVGG